MMCERQPRPVTAARGCLFWKESVAAAKKSGWKMTYQGHPPPWADPGAAANDGLRPRTTAVVIYFAF